jgi:hypothetical protein
MSGALDQPLLGYGIASGMLNDLTSILPALTSDRSRWNAGRSIVPPEKPPSSFLQGAHAMGSDVLALLADDEADQEKSGSKKLFRRGDAVAVGVRRNRRDRRIIRRQDSPYPRRAGAKKTGRTDATGAANLPSTQLGGAHLLTSSTPWERLSSYHPQAGPMPIPTGPMPIPTLKPGA